MHLNHYFLKKLAPRIGTAVTGTKLLGAFSQDKNEIILEFGTDDIVTFTIRAILKADFTSLYFPEKFERARANSVDLFKGLFGQSVKGVLTYENERAFALLFERGDKLVFKLFGNRSNLLHFDAAQQLVAVFNHSLSSDLTLQEDTLHRKTDQSFDQFLASGGDYGKIFPTFGKLVNQHISSLLNAEQRPEEQWQIIQNVIADLNKGQYYLTEYRGTTTLSLLPVGEVTRVYDDPIEAVNAFCLSFFRVGNLQKEKDQVTKQLTRRIAQTESYLDNAYDKLGKIADTGRNEQLGNLLMANLHNVAPRSELIEVEDFYNGGRVSIKLKPDLSPAKNAESYFRKAKNEKVEIARLQENIEARESGLALMKSWIAAIAQQTTVKDLRLYIRQNQVLGQSSSPETTTESRFRKETYMGYQIFIGKNAKNNDELTLKYAGKEDLWLHAKDVSGSHVIIRNIPGKTTPAAVIERAAELAAWHSKRRTDSLCPVSFTPRKFVRKSKGMAAGAVTVEKESVVMVVPKA